MFDFSLSSIISFLYAIPGVLFALSIHEFSHGYVAYKLGDPTARSMGRLTLNPIKHIDVFGLIAMFVVGVGWAKPVPVNTRNFRKTRRDMALTALAGPVSNLISAFIGMFLFYGFYLFAAPYIAEASMNLFQGITVIFRNFIFLNIGLAVFNLIPIPPLDGSRILDSFLPPKALVLYHRYEDIVRVILLAVLIFDLISISPIVDYIFIGMANAAEFVFGLFIN